MDINLNERSQQLMKNLVERYIADGQPVGSKTLSSDTSLSVSPATIRNVMKQLEDLGLIRSPHTSAGRVPTELGYRFYVDTMLNVQPMKQPRVKAIQAELLKKAGGNQQLVQKASSLLSEMTQMAGVVMTAKQDAVCLRQIEFLPLDGNQVLAILVVNNKEVQNRIITTERRYSESELTRAANYLTRTFSGKQIQEMAAALHKELINTQSEVNQLMELMVKVSGSIEGSGKDDALLVEGQSNLIGGSGLDSMDKLKRLFDAFSEKRDIAHLLEGCSKGDGVQIFIGQESGYEPLGDCSVVTAPYSVDGDTVGVLGVIGPTRMNYERIVPVVDVTARLVGAALSQEEG